MPIFYLCIIYCSLEGKEMGFNDFWINKNGKNEHLSEAKHGIRKEQLDVEFHNLFDTYDINRNGTLENNELENVFNGLNKFAGADKILDASENKKAGAIFTDIMKIENADFMGFVKSVSNASQDIISSQTTTSKDGGKEITTTYKDGTVETVAYYADGDFKYKKIAKPIGNSQQQSQSDFVVSERASEDVSVRDFVLTHFIETHQAVKDALETMGFLDDIGALINTGAGEVWNSIKNIWNGTSKEYQNFYELVDKFKPSYTKSMQMKKVQDTAQKNPENYFKGEIGRIDTTKGTKFQQITEQYQNAQILQQRLDILNKAVSEIRMFQAKLGATQYSPTQSEGMNPHEHILNVNKLLLEYFNGDEDAVNMILNGATNNADAVIKAINDIKQETEQLNKSVLGGKTFQDIKNDYQEQYKAIYGTDFVPDELTEKVMDAKATGGMVKLAAITAITVLITKSQIMKQMMGAAAGSAELTGAAANMIRTLTARHGATAVQQGIKLAMTSGTLATDVGLTLLNQATSERGVDGQELWESTKGSAKYIYFGSYIGSHFAQAVSRQLGKIGATARMFEGGIKTTTSGIQTTTITGEKLFQNLMKGGNKVLTTGGAFLTDVAAFSALEITTEGQDLLTAGKEQTEMLGKLKIMNHFIECVLGGRVHADMMKAKMDAAIENSGIKNWQIKEIKTPNKNVYEVQLEEGLPPIRFKDANELATAMMERVAEVYEGVKSEVKSKDKSERPVDGFKAPEAEYKPALSTKEEFAQKIEEFFLKNGEEFAVNEEELNFAYESFYKSNAKTFDTILAKNNDGTYKYTMAVFQAIVDCINNNTQGNISKIFVAYDIIKNPEIPYNKDMGISELEYNIIKKMDANRKSCHGDESEYGIDDILEFTTLQQNDIQKNLTLFLVEKGCFSSDICILKRLATIQTQEEANAYRNLIEQIEQIPDKPGMTVNYVTAVDEITTPEIGNLVVEFVKAGYNSYSATSIARIAKFNGVYARLDKILKELKNNSAEAEQELQNLLELDKYDRLSSLEGIGVLESERFNARQLLNLTYSSIPVERIKCRDLLNKYPQMSSVEILRLADCADSEYKIMLDKNLLDKYSVEDAKLLARNYETIKANGLLDIPDLSVNTILEFDVRGKTYVQQFKNEPELSKLGAIGYNNIRAIMRMDDADKAKAIAFIKQIYNNEELKPFLENKILDFFSMNHAAGFDEKIAQQILTTYQLIANKKHLPVEERASIIGLVQRFPAEWVIELSKREFLDSKTMNEILQHKTSQDDFNISCNIIDICHENNIPSTLISNIAIAANKQNYKFLERLCTDKELNFPADKIANTIYYTNSVNIALAERLCTDKELNFPVDNIADILNHIISDNIALAERLCTDKELNFPTEKIAKILHRTKSDNIALAERLCTDKELNFPADKIGAILGATKYNNIELAERLCTDKKLNFPTYEIADIIHYTYPRNISLAERLCTDKELNFPTDRIADILECTNSGNIALAERLCTDKELNFPADKIGAILSATKSDNIALTERLCTDKELNFPVDDISKVLHTINENNLSFASKIITDKSIPHKYIIDVLQYTHNNRVENIESLISNPQMTNWFVRNLDNGLDIPTIVDLSRTQKTLINEQKNVKPSTNKKSTEQKQPKVEEIKSDNIVEAENQLTSFESFP